MSPPSRRPARQSRLSLAADRLITEGPASAPGFRRNPSLQALAEAGVAAQSDDWLPLGEAFDRLDAGAALAAREIIGRGEVPIYALRSDLPGSTTPAPVRKLLAQASWTFISGDEISATYDGPKQDIRSILGPRSNLQSEVVMSWTYGIAACTVAFRSSRVHWPELVDALAAAGYAVSAVNAPEAFLPAEPTPAAEQAAGSSEALHGKSLDDALVLWARGRWGEDLKKLPPRKELLSLARTKPRFKNVTQQDIRELRRRLAPDEIKRGGGRMHRRS
jgi:hypothetical protein